MQVETPPSPTENRTDAKAPPLQTAYAPRDRSSPVSMAFYCILCGTRVAPTDETCSICGCPVQLPRDDDSRVRQRSRPLYPVRGVFAISTAILIPIGLIFFISSHCR